MDPAELAARGWTRETKIRRDKYGVWYEDDQAVEHHGITKAFDRWVARAPDGRYCLENDIHWVYVDIEGPPVFVRGLEMSEGNAMLALSDGRAEWVEPTSLRQGPDGALYCDVRQGSLPARFDTHAAMLLMDVLEEDDEGVFVKLGGQVVRPPVVDDPLRPLPKDGPHPGA